MRVLLVEDEEATLDRIERALAARIPGLELVSASNRDEAIQAITSGHFDFIVCDLKIPPQRNDLNVAEEFGLQVHERARNLQPGTLSLFFTGYATPTNTRDALSRAPTDDVFGRNEQLPLVQLLTKDEFDPFIDHLTEVAVELKRLAAIHVHGEGAPRADDLDQRAVRIFASRNGGQSVELHHLEGLSNAKAFRAFVTDASGATVARVFCKIGPRDKLDVERTRYFSRVPMLLPVGSFAPWADEVRSNLGSRIAHFYSLAEFSSDLFGALAGDPAKGGEVVRRIRQILFNWAAARGAEMVSVGDLRRRVLTDQLYERLALPSLAVWASVEEQEINLVTSIQHGDLHPGNVLLTVDQNVMLVDFADAEFGSVCLDPVTLELSLLFHPNRPFSDAWPSDEQLESYWDLDTVLVNCPAPEFIAACREWSLDACSEKQVAATAYAHALRQLRYESADHARVLRLARASARVVLGSEGSPNNV